MERGRGDIAKRYSKKESKMYRNQMNGYDDFEEFELFTEEEPTLGFLPDENGISVNDIDSIQTSNSQKAKSRKRGKSFITIEQYLLSRFLFLLKPGRDRDYFFATHDPDANPEWEDVL